MAGGRVEAMTFLTKIALTIGAITAALGFAAFFGWVLSGEGRGWLVAMEIAGGGNLSGFCLLAASLVIEMWKSP